MTNTGLARPSIPVPSGVGRSARVLVVDDSVTILRVVQRILERHGYEVACARDGVEGMQQLSLAGPFDVVLLDFVMPRKNGYQFVREVRAEPDHRETPVVLMSARTNAIGDRFVEQTGAVDALSKPFDARALVAVVGGVIARGADPEAHGREMPSPDAMVAEEELGEKAPESIIPSAGQLNEVNRLARVVAEAVSPPLRELNPEDLAMPNVVEQAVFSGLQSAKDITRELVEGAAEIAHTVTNDEILSGRLSKLPLAELLQMLQLRRQTGVMEVRYKRRLMTLFIRDGMLELAQSANLDREFRLGRYLIRHAQLTREELDELVEQRQDGREQFLGEQLLEMERIDEAQLYRALAQQSAELMYEVLRWPEGYFRLLDRPISEEAQRANLELGLGELALEGFRRVDEWRLMADTVDFNAVLSTDKTAVESIDKAKLSKDERTILNAIDGARTARDVIEFSRLASFDAVKVIYGFLQSRLVRATAKPVMSGSHPPPPPQGEPRIEPLERPTLRQPSSSSVNISPPTVSPPTGGPPSGGPPQRKTMPSHSGAVIPRPAKAPSDAGTPKPPNTLQSEPAEPAEAPEEIDASDTESDDVAPPTA